MTESAEQKLEALAREYPDLQLGDAYEKLRELLAAALAVCAREAEKPLREALAWAIDRIEREYGYRGPRLEEEEFLRAKAALERAAGESSLDPQGGQHDS